MRPVDLATRAGVSTQQVRNLEAAGVLPAAERTRSGYRIYGDEHLDALLCYQALAPGYGAQRARTIMSAIIAGDSYLALEIIDAAHAELHQQRQALDATTRVLTQVTSTVDEQPAPVAPLSIGEAAHYLGVRTSTLRVWEDAGLLTPERRTPRRYRVYGANDIRDARVVHVLRQGGYRFDRIRPVIEGLQRSGSVDALRAALTERRTALNLMAQAMLHSASLICQYMAAYRPAGSRSKTDDPES